MNLFVPNYETAFVLAQTVFNLSFFVLNQTPFVIEALTFIILQKYSPLRDIEQAVHVGGNQLPLNYIAVLRMGDVQDVLTV